MLPVVAAIWAAPHADAADGEDGAWLRRADGDPVHIHRVIVDVVALADALPLFAAIQATQEPPDLDRGIEFCGVGGIDRDAEDTLGGDNGAYGDIGERHIHRQAIPAFAAVLASIDGIGFIPSEHDVGIARMKQQ